MRYQKISQAGDAAIYLLVYASGEAFMHKLAEVVRVEAITCGSFHALGAVSEATLQFFKPGHGEYLDIPVHEQVEVVSLHGTIATDEGKAQVHAHAVLAKADGTCVGGHLKDANVHPTLELVLIASPAKATREYDKDLQLALLKLDPARSREI